MVNVVKFSEFTNGGDIANDNITVGLGGSSPYYNARYNNPWTFLPSGTTAARPTPAASMYYRLRLNTSLQEYEYYDPISVSWVQLTTANQIDWVVVTTTPYQMIPNQAYITDSAVQIHLILPTVSAIGEEISIAGKGTGGFIITQGAGQSIKLAPLSTTVGAGGSLASTQQYNSISLVCIEDNLTWTTRGGPQGDFAYI